MNKDLQAQLQKLGVQWADLQELIEQRLGVELAVLTDSHVDPSSEVLVRNAGELIQIGNLTQIVRSELSADSLLATIRNSVATAIAKKHLAVADHGHYIHVTPLITVRSVASWMCEMSFDFDDYRYALVAEYIEPVDVPPGFRRVYKLHQAKTGPLCDVIGCKMAWRSREVTIINDYVVHLCWVHRNADPDRVFARIKGQLTTTKKQEVTNDRS